MLNNLCPPLITTLQQILKKTKNKRAKRPLRSLIKKLKSSMKSNDLDESVFEVIEKILRSLIPRSFKNIIKSVIVPILSIFVIKKAAPATTAYFMGEDFSNQKTPFSGIRASPIPG
jgi:hypothetical protein